jgi:hypothetical protein
MRRSLMSLVVLTMMTAAPRLRAQSASLTIDPGMSRAQVIAVLGQPAAVRSYDSTTYLLYRNGCEKTCGMQDLVVLERDSVTNAVFRSPERHYSGTSSSPEQKPPHRAAKHASALAKPAPEETTHQ